MGTWGVGVFANDLAADVRGEWRDAVLDGAEPEAATQRIVDEFGDALVDEDDAPRFWIALAAAQMETGRLQPEIRDRALSTIASGGDVPRWQSEGNIRAARQRAKVLERLAEKLRGPQPAPKRLRRPSVHAVAFDIGDIVAVRSASGSREAIVLVVDEYEYPPGHRHPVLEVLLWEAKRRPSVDEVLLLPPLLTDSDAPKSPPLRPMMFVATTHRSDQAFGPHMGEIIGKGAVRKPSGDYRNGAHFGGEVVTSYGRWSTLAAMVDGPWHRKLVALTREAQRRSLLT
jgi:hypothetical protein